MGDSGKVVIEEGVVLEFYGVDFSGTEVERVRLRTRNISCLSSIRTGEKVTDLEDEAASFLKQRRIGLGRRAAPEQQLASLLEKCARRSATAFFRILLLQLRERVSELRGSLKSLVQHDVIDR